MSSRARGRATASNSRKHRLSATPIRRLSWRHKCAELHTLTLRTWRGRGRGTEHTPPRGGQHQNRRRCQGIDYCGGRLQAGRFLACPDNCSHVRGQPTKESFQECGAGQPCVQRREWWGGNVGCALLWLDTWMSFGILWFCPHIREAWGIWGCPTSFVPCASRRPQ